MLINPGDAVSFEGFKYLARVPLITGSLDHFKHHRFIVPYAECDDGAFRFEWLFDGNIPLTSVTPNPIKWFSGDQAVLVLIQQGVIYRPPWLKTDDSPTPGCPVEKM